MTIWEAKQKVLNVAISNIGYRESGDNIIKFASGTWDNTFYGWELQGQPWCDVFVDYCFCTAFGNQLGAAMTYQRLGSGSALCRASAQYYKDNNSYFNYPEVGDQIFFYYGGAINHTGIVETVNGSGSGWTSLTTIEGNTSDQVARRTYRRGDGSIAGFGRPKWSLVVNEEGGEEEHVIIEDDTPDVPQTPAQPQYTYICFGNVDSNVKTLQENLIKLGYDCGPDGADGEFGKNTYAAVKEFQKKNNLEVDGIVGPLTQKAIEDAIKKLDEKEETIIVVTPPPATEPTFQVGDKVRLKANSTVYNSKIKIPQIIASQIWIIKSIQRDKVTLNKYGGNAGNTVVSTNKENLIKI